MNYRLRNILIAFCSVLPLVAWPQAPLPILKPAFTYTLSTTEFADVTPVAWYPGLDVYLTITSNGNSYFLEIFDQSGVSKFRTSTFLDMGSCWYNPRSKKMEGNLDQQSEWVTFELDDRFQVVYLKKQRKPENFQHLSYGAMDEGKGDVIFRDDVYSSLKLSIYDAENTDRCKYLNLDLGACITSEEDLMWNCVGYTGHKGYEFAMIDNVKDRLLLFNRKGDLTANVGIPTTKSKESFTLFSIANDHLFLFNKLNRTWHAYEIW